MIRILSRLLGLFLPIQGQPTLMEVHNSLKIEIELHVWLLFELLISLVNDVTKRDYIF